MKEVRELVLNAALLGVDYDSFGLFDLEEHPPQLHTLSSLLSGAEFTWHAMEHIAPFTPRVDEGDEHDRQWKELVLRRRAADLQRTPNPRVYRVRIVVELEPLSDEESRRLINEARERHIDLENRRRETSGGGK